MAMFHRAQAMSSLSTPTRISRGLIIPGIDTKPRIDTASSTLSYGGLYTPPQSAHESRRPSLQYSVLSDAPHSAASYTFHSQPVTPVRGNDRESDIFTPRWSQTIDVENITDTSVCAPSSASPIDNPSAHAPFEVPIRYHHPVVGGLPMYSPINRSNGVDQFDVHDNLSPPLPESWPQGHEISNSYYAQNACLGSTLFPSAHGMDGAASSAPSIFDQMTPSLHAVNYDYRPSSMDAVQGYRAPSALYQQPQVVVPSQVSPSDEYQEDQFQTYETGGRDHHGLANSFGPSSMSFEDYDMVGPPSPQDAYFANSEDDDYLMVRMETVATLPRDFVPNRPGLRPRRRASRGSRHAGNRTAHCLHNNNGVDIRCEGKQCYLQPLNPKLAGSKKPWECTFIEEDGRPCPSRFDRSEHLKRHDGKHSEFRKYPCPLPGCNGKMGRPDNAGDHFKTHLRGKRPGKRNLTFSWEEVHNAIRNDYEQKVATKLLDGLRRWINRGMPETPGTKRTGRNQ